MSLLTRTVKDIDNLIQRTRGISLDPEDTDVLRRAMEKLNGHFHALPIKRCGPHPFWPKGYLELEAEYCRVTTLQKRREFNNIWNDTHTEKFQIQDDWGRE